MAGSLVRRNVIANTAGKGWTALVSLAAVPVYLHFLGVEAYGLIAVFLSLTAIFSLFDLGLGTALNRQLAQRSLQAGEAQAMRDLVRTLEIIYWLVAVAIALLMLIAAPYIASYWIRPQGLAAESVAQTLMLMGVAIACLWPRALYVGGLAGLQQQVLLNVLGSAFAGLLHIGGAVIVWQVSSTLDALVMWHIVVGLLETLVTAVMLWRRLPPAQRRASFEVPLLVTVWRFAAGMTGISLTSVLLTQLDKVILSRLLTLEVFGYYSLAARAAAGLYYLVGPITTAVFPRLSQLAAQTDTRELARLYHRASQLVAAVIAPVTLVLALYAAEVLWLWTGDQEIAARTSGLLALLVLGTACNGLMSLPLAAQMAHGMTRLVVMANLVAVAVLAPLTWLMAARHGAMGAASVWLLLNVGYLLFLLPLMHRRMLPGHMRQWLVADVAAPFAAALAAGYTWKLVTGTAATYGGALLQVGGALLLSTLAALVAAAQLRASVFQWLARQRTAP